MHAKKLLLDAVLEFARRVQRDLDRYAAGSKPGTELAAGWPKVSNRVRDVVIAAAQLVCDAEGRDITVELVAAAKSGADLQRATMLDLELLARRLARLPSAKRREVRRVFEDVCGKPSVLHIAVERRNALLHERAVDDAKESVRVLKLVRELLRTVEADLRAG